MPMQSDFMQSQDFDIRTIYIVLLCCILILVFIANFIILILLYRGGLRTCNIPLRILITAKLVASTVYVGLDCLRAVVYLKTYTSDPVILETYLGCGVFYWITSSAQWIVSLTLTWAMLKRILNLRHHGFHSKYIHPRTAIIFVIASVIFAFGLNAHYFNTKLRTVDFSQEQNYGINGTHKICLPELGSSYKTFWQDVWPILDAIIHIVLPTAVWLPVLVAIEVHFNQDENMLLAMKPGDRIKLVNKRKRDKSFITNLGWTRAMLYAGTVYMITNMPLNIYLWYRKWDKFFALFYFNGHETLSLLFIFDVLKYAPHILWFAIYDLTGCDGRKVVQKKTASEHALPVGGSRYSLRSRSMEDTRARPSRSTEDSRI